MLLTLYQLNLAGGPRLYYVVGPTSGWTTPTAAEIVAGTLSGGGTATAAGSMAAPTSTSTVTFPTTSGLTAGAGYTGALVWWDGTNASNVVTTAWTQTSAGSYTLTADVASFTLAGIDAGLLFGRRLFADQQSYTLTGIDAGTLFGRRLTADQATFTLSGQDAGLVYAPGGAYTITAETGTFTLSGVNAGLTYTPLNSYTLTAETVSFALTGRDAGLTYAPLNNFVLTANTGAFTLTGQSAGLQYSGDTGTSGRIVRRGRTKFPQPLPPAPEETPGPTPAPRPVSLLDTRAMELTIQQGVQVYRKKRVQELKRKIAIEKRDEESIDKALLEFW